MRLQMRRMPLALAVLAATLPSAPLRAEDETVLIEFVDDRSALPSAVNDNGTVVVGNYNLGGGFYWMPTVGEVFAGGLLASAVSSDGATIVGTADDSAGLRNAGIWLRAADWRLLGSFPNAVACGPDLSYGLGVSRDGRVVVGFAYYDNCNTHAFRWEESTGMTDLTPTNPESTRAQAISGDGRVVVGDILSSTRFPSGEGVRWVDGREELFAGPGPEAVVGSAMAANHDGSVVVGKNCRALVFLDQSAWVWTADGGLTCLDAPAFRPPEIKVNGVAQATSDDGRVIGGYQGSGEVDSDAVLWIDGSPAYLKDYLRANGVEDAFARWINTGEITGVSPDGRILVGWGAAIGGPRGYIVILGSEQVTP